MKLVILAIVCWMGIAVAHAETGTIGYVERFSLAEDRSEALESLIPGTSDYYFYHCLHAQHTGDFERVHQLLDAWIAREGHSARVEEIRNRQVLLESQRDPEAAYRHIEEKLSLRFDHQRERAEASVEYPTQLDPRWIAPETLRKHALRRHRNLDGITDRGLYSLPAGSLDGDRRRDLLRRLTRPDFPNLAELVVADLRYRRSGGFGSHPIHRELIRSQLDECLRRMPELRKETAFIQTYLAKLAPSEDVSPRYDPQARKAHLDRMWAFAKDLDPAHNSLKAHVLYGILDFHRQRGGYDAARDRFTDYIRLPRNVAYIEPDYIRKRAHSHVRADLRADFAPSTGMSPIGSDEALVRDYLTHYFKAGEGVEPFSRYIKDDYLQRLFVETQILAGRGDMETWYSKMDPADYRRLKDRVDIAFAPENPRFFNRDADVGLEVWVKNVTTLIIKVFEINTFNYFAAEGQAIDTSIDLDGLTATWERTETYQVSPLRQVRRHFDFPEIDHPGTYVVELIGNGKSSRAVIRKGRLFFTETVGPAGHELIIYDETGRHRPEATLWLAGRTYDPDSDGRIIIPFSTRPGRQSVILKDGSLHTLSAFHHRAESYRLSAGIYVDREQLLRRREATVLIRPQLFVADQPISPKILEEVRLIVESKDRRGVTSRREFPEISLLEDQETTVTVPVPDQLAGLRLTLAAKVQSVSRHKKEDLSDSVRFAVNAIDGTLQVADLFLRRSEAGYRIEARGKNGEARPGQPVHLELHHRDFREAVTVTLRTDGTGRIGLGPLSGIDRIEAGGSGGKTRSWPLLADRCQYPRTICGRVGEPLRIPVMAGEENPSLLERRGGTFVADQTEAVRRRDGYLELSGLPAGDYALHLPEAGRTIRIRLTEGHRHEGFVISDGRVLETLPEAALQILDAGIEGDMLRVRLGGAGPFARLHVFATRFMPGFDPFAHLPTPGLPSPYQIRPARPESQYLIGRDIGDEYRYVLDRRYAEIYPGNMLRRPELLLNPWPLRSTETDVDTAAAGSRFQRERTGADRREAASAPAPSPIAPAEAFDNLDFLAAPSAVLTNLRPDADGVVTVPAEKLGQGTGVHLLAVDPVSTVYRALYRPDREIRTRDLRMAEEVAPETHVIEGRRMTAVETGERFEIGDLSEAEMAIYDSLESAYRILLTLSDDEDLKTFQFAVQWPDLDEADKRKNYSEYACHELNFFLYHKDRPFFERVVRPYLAHKKDKTFMDHYLLGADLSDYLAPWAFARLNIVEKILLAKGGGWDPEDMRRYMRDLYETVPPDIEAFNRLFDIALKGRAMEPDDYGVAAAQDAAFQMKAEALLSEDLDLDMADEAAPMPPPPSMARSKMAAAPAPEAEGLAGAGDFRPGRQAEREAARPLYQAIDKTREWAENNYYHLPIEEQTADLITVNGFWDDFAQAPADQPFRSPRFVEAAGSFAEMMLALAVLDLPFRAEEHETAIDARSFSLTAASPLIVFHKEITPAPEAAAAAPMMVSRSYFRPDDRYRYEGHERVDKRIDGDFRFGAAYGCQWVVSNPTSARRKLSILSRIPRGGMPIQNGFYTRGRTVTVESYATQTGEYFFYFPETGRFSHYPTQVSEEAGVIATSDADTMNVVAEVETVDRGSWQDISQNGTDAEVLDYLREENLHRIDPEAIAFRMRDRGFFNSAIEILRNRRIYNHLLWSYGIHHQDRSATRTYLEHSPYADQCGMAIDTPLLTVDPVARRTYQHLEYRPLVNARTHPLGDGPKILNNRFHHQYHQLMTYLSYRPALTDADRMAVTYYLLLQDRIAEAIRFFNMIDPGEITTRIQYDYLRTYIDLYNREIDRARETAEAYADYPVDRWRDLFREAAAQIREITGEEPESTDPDDRDARQGRLAAAEPSFDFSVTDRRLTIRYQNLSACRVNIYPMDLELLFSRNPFVETGADHFAYIRPNATMDVDLPKEKASHTLTLPEDLKSANLMVEVTAEGIRKATAVYTNDLDVQVIETYGHLRVSHAETGRPLSAVYVKAYARMQSGEVIFYKDGYTDLRGRFDYASLSTDTLDRVDRFAVLVLSEDHGAVIRESGVPKR